MYHYLLIFSNSCR